MGVQLLIRWLAPDAQPDAYNDWRFIVETAWGVPVLVFVGVVLLLSLGLSAKGLATIPLRRSFRILSVRFLSLVVLFAIFLEPAVELRALSRTRSRVAVVIDDSASMALATPRGTRAERVLSHISRNRAVLEDAARVANFDWYRFSDRVLPLPGEIKQPLPSEGKQTDLQKALDDLSFRRTGDPFAAVVVYTDGSDTEGLTPSRARALGESLGSPIIVVGFGDDASAPDLAIRKVPADDFAFVHNTFRFDVDLEVRGLELDRVPVTLKHNERILQTKPAVFDRGRAEVSFDFKPRRIGKQVYEIDVPVQASETVRSNNRKSLVLNVIRDRIRILQVAGRPSWDQRFLREHLERDPSIDLISFFILRSTTDVQKAAQDELALIPFPVHELFTEELDTFDIVIYQNFSYRPYRMDRYLPNLARYVREGGSFLMVGGELSFEDGWYAGTSLASVLPVRLGGALPFDPASYQPRLTGEGRLHPVTRIGAPGEPLDRAFSRLPKLQGANASLGLAPGATALLRHPTLPENPPVVAVRDVGKGRSMAVATDSTWLWRFEAVGDGLSGREYERFWSGALRWLVRDPELDRVRIRLNRSVVAPDRPIQGEVEILGPDYRPLEHADVVVRFVRANSGARSEKGLRSELPEPQSVRTGENGKASFRFEPIEPGTYRVVAEASTKVEETFRKLGVASEPLIVEATDLERQVPFPRPDIGAALSVGSGGAYHDIEGPFPPLEVAKSQKVEVDRSRRIPIWDDPPVLVLLLIVLGAEWWLRRRAGLL